MKKPTLSTLKNKAWSHLSKCIRKEAADSIGYVQCFTCTWVGKWASSQAGHAIGGRSGAVLFDEEVIRTQCYRCNIPLRGNYGVFAFRLIQEHGEEWYAKKLLDSHKVVKYSRVDYLEMIDRYKERLKCLNQN